jgi:hypothetical protein
MSEVAPLIVGNEEPSTEVQQLMNDVADWERIRPGQGEMQTLREGYEALFLHE